MTSLKSTAIRRDAFDVFFPRWRHCQRHFKTLASHPVDERRHQHLIPADENVQALTLPSHPVRPLWTQKHQSVSKEARKMLFMAVALLTKSTPEARIAKLELFHTSPALAIPRSTDETPTRLSLRSRNQGTAGKLRADLAG